MREVNREDLIPGMVVSEDIVNFGEQLVLPKGTILNDNMITKLENYSILRVRVEDNLLHKKDENTNKGTYLESLVNSVEFQEYQSQFQEEVNEFKIVLNDIVEKNIEPDCEKMFEQAMNLMAASPNVNLFEIIRNIQKYDDSTFAHSMNVALLSNVFAHWLNYNPEDIKLATIAGLMHDIGKLKIPGDIIKKPARLTDEELVVVKTHPIEGYMILQNYSINPHIKNAALMHHEKCDGSGYPMGLKAEDIDKFAKLISIVDVYDAMTSARIYRGPMCPFDVIEIFEDEGFQSYDTRYIITFLNKVANSYLNQTVRLNTGEEGKLVLINKDKFSRPLVMCDDRVVDLRKEKNKKIDMII